MKEVCDMLYKDWEIVLTGEHIRITPLTERDEEPYSRLLLGDMYDRLKRTMGDVMPSNLTGVLNRTSGDEMHAIRLLNDERFIGWITLQKNDEDQPEVGISLIEEQQNKGYGPEAVMLFANRLHDVYGLRTIFVLILKENVQSQRAFAKVGAVFDRALPDKHFAALKKAYNDTPGSSCPPEGMDVPMVYHYHIPLPIDRPMQGSTEDSGEGHSIGTQKDGMERIATKAALDELTRLEKKMEQLGDADIEKITEYIQSRMDAIKKERYRDGK